MIRVAAAFLVLRFAASDDDDGARFAFGSKAPAAGDYAKVACGSGYFRAARLKPAQVTAAYEICAELDERMTARVVTSPSGDAERRCSPRVRSMWILSNANQLLCDVPQYVTIATVHNRKDKMRIILVFQR